MSRVQLLDEDQINSMLNQKVEVSPSLWSKCNQLTLHNPISIEKLAPLFQIRQLLLKDSSRDMAIQSHPRIDSQKIAPFICLENDWFIITLGKRSKVVDENEIIGSSKNVSEAILIYEDNRVEHVIELAPIIDKKHLEQFEFDEDSAQGFLIREYYTMRVFRDNPNVAQSHTLFLKYNENIELAIVNLMVAYEGSIIRLFYHVLDYLAKEAPINFLKNFLSVFHGFAKGLLALHQYGVHGDITPGNIYYYKLKSGYYTGVVADFESYLVGDVVARAMQGNGPLLMAPEVEDTLTRCSDIYAFGSIMMLVRNRFIIMVIQASVPDRNMWAEVSKKMIADIFGPIKINELIDSMMAQNPQDRPKISEVVSTLEEQLSKFDMR
ncbi:MAG: hypothetical protein P0S95_08315 [Rhabdochlamydiaceae bacterium]|nr:hypothetical protein [Candidatus Amphrikana amoebophyrae]